MAILCYTNGTMQKGVVPVETERVDKEKLILAVQAAVGPERAVAEDEKGAGKAGEAD